MDEETGKDISGVERKVHKRTSVSSTGFRQKNENGSKYIGLCYRRSFINEV